MKSKSLKETDSSTPLDTQPSSTELTESAPLDYCTQTIALKRTIQSAFLVLSERLYNIRQTEMWRSNWTSWAEYLAELDISEATASKLIKVHEFYVLEHKVDETFLSNTGWDMLYNVIPLVEPGIDPRDVIQKFSGLRRDDQREVLREAKKGPCEHTWEPIKFRRCTTCGKMERIT